MDIPLPRIFVGFYANLNQDGNVKEFKWRKDLNDTDAQVFHARLDFEPTESLSMMLTADWTDRDEQAQAQRLLSLSRPPV